MSKAKNKLLDEDLKLIKEYIKNIENKLTVEDCLTNYVKNI